MKQQLETLPDVGSVTVTTNSIKLDSTLTASVTKGLNTVVPSADPSAIYSVGDWIRLSSASTGEVFSVTAMSASSPFTITLSSAYLGETETTATAYMRNVAGSEFGYQYIVTFDSNLGDLSAMTVATTNLGGSNKLVEVTACTWHQHQTVTTSVAAAGTIGGTFYLTYNGESTTDLAYDISAPDLSAALLELSSIYAITVTLDVPVSATKGSTWTVIFLSFEGETVLPLYAEGHLLSQFVTDEGVSTVTVAGDSCSSSSSANTVADSQVSVAGRLGENYVVTLTGADTASAVVSASATTDGEYTVTYNAPKAGSYSMTVENANVGGLTGSYFNNRWLYGAPVMTRVDPTIDFTWSDADVITPTGKDYISVRWEGYVQPAFDEVYTFFVQADDGARLWIDGELLFDEYEHEVSGENSYVEHSGVTSVALKAGQLVDIKLEFRENTGSAMVKLLWESFTQPNMVVPTYRLFSSSDPISGSPFTVTPVEIEPNEPSSCTVSIAAWDEILVTWNEPSNDGGADITGYKVEWWSADTGLYGNTEIQQFKIPASVTGTFTITSPGGNLYPVSLDVSTSAAFLESALESLADVGDVTVSRAETGGNVVFTIEFNTDTNSGAALNVIAIDGAALSTANDFCICQAASVNCNAGSSWSASPTGACTTGETRASTATLSSGGSDTAIDMDVAEGNSYTYTIVSADQDSSTAAGFSARVYATNDSGNGYGVPCAVQTIKPMSGADAPAVVEVDRVAGSNSQLNVYFTMVSYPEDRASAVTTFDVEYSTSSSFEASVTETDSVALAAIASSRLSTYNDPTNSDYVSPAEDVYVHTIENLTPGTPYFVRVAAVNAVGAGTPSVSSPLSLSPGTKPDQLEYESGVSLTTVAADKSVSVLESSSSLLLSWQSPFSSNGFASTEYNLEWWAAAGTDEIIEVSVNGATEGTFSLTYDGATTDSLDYDISKANMISALESLSTVGSVAVDRSAAAPNFAWTITFLSETPTVSNNALTANFDATTTDATTIVIGGGTSTSSVLATGYTAKKITVDDPTASFFSNTITGLTAGQLYYARVSAKNELGFSVPQTSLPLSLAPPAQKPSEPLSSSLLVSSGQSLKMLWKAPDSNGGETVTKYKVEWDTSTSFDSSSGSPMGSHTKLLSTPATDCITDACYYVIGGLTKGTSYYVRVYAYNSYGFSSKAGIPEPVAESPKSQADPPSKVSLTPSSESSLKVSFNPTSDNGGGDVTKYKIEWDTMNTVPGVSLSDATSDYALYVPNEIQSITTSADVKIDQANEYFRLMFDDHITSDLVYNVSPNEMKVSLEALPTIGSVSVSRAELLNGYEWRVTFLTNSGADAWFGDVPALTVSSTPRLPRPLPSLLSHRPRPPPP